jgi:hypothetical protein
MWKYLFLGFMLTGILFGMPVTLRAASFGGFGDSLDQAQKTDFFTWFHLQKTGEAKTAQATVTTFKPSGEKFHDLATFRVTTAPAGGLTAVHLTLSRAFVDNKKDGIFARDIAKSLLRTVFAGGSDPEVQDLANEIEYLDTSGARLIIHESRKPPKLPSQPTPGYLTYLGKQQTYEHAVGGKVLRLENGTLDGEESLVILIRKK